MFSADKLTELQIKIEFLNNNLYGSNMLFSYDFDNFHCKVFMNYS